MRILLAEDNEINQQLGVRLLQRQGHEVTLARDGEEALQRVIASPNGFDLVLMDMQMPIMDGVAATAAIRRHEAECGGRIPIIALTAHFGPDKLQRCLDAGMDAGVTKPIDIAELEAAMAAVVGEGSAEVPTPQEPSTVLGWDAALDLVLGDEALLCQMATLFLERSDGMLAEVEDAHQRGAAYELERAAHKLKGSVGNFGAAEAIQAAERVEDAAEAGDLAAASDLLEPLRVSIADVCSELRRRVAGAGA